MGFLKGLAISLSSLLLFLSLSIFGLVFMLNQTILSPDFATSQMEKLDLASMTKELITPALPAEFLEQEFVTQGLDKTIADLEPWVKEEASNVIHRGYDYLLGKSQSLSFTISLEQFKTTLNVNVWQAVLEDPPPELQGIPPALAEQYFNQYYSQFAGEIPSSFEFDISSLGPEVTSQLEQTRQVIGYVKLGFWILIGLMVVLILAIFLINRNMRATSRSLGITFLIYGIFEFVFVLLMKSALIPEIPLPELPSPTLEAWVLGFTTDLMGPLQIFSIGVAVFGVVLIIASFFFEPSEESF